MIYKHFSAEEREKIQRGLWEKRSVRAIARELRRTHSSVLRELKRNYPPIHERYTPRLAHERALFKRTRRGREKRLPNVLRDAKLPNSPKRVTALLQWLKQDVLAYQWEGKHIGASAFYHFKMSKKNDRV